MQLGEFLVEQHPMFMEIMGILLVLGVTGLVFAAFFMIMFIIFGDL